MLPPTSLQNTGTGSGIGGGVFGNPVWITGTAALMMLLMNLAGSQISAGLTPYQKKTLQSPWVRWIAIYAIFFVGTRNPWMAFLLGSGAILLLDFLLNETSRLYLFRRTSDTYNSQLVSPGSMALHMWE
jgi:hypothetical protein